MNFARRITDHRGNPHRLVSGTPHGLDDRCKRDLLHVVLRPSSLAIMVVAGLLLPTVFAHLFWMIADPSPSRLARVVAWALALAGVIVYGRIHFGSLYARAYLNNRYCPSCGYDLADTPSANDGCRLCPECGAAWKLP